jgi:predicted TIM-barrel fold metal-dependent hydrolase
MPSSAIKALAAALLLALAPAAAFAQTAAPAGPAPVRTDHHLHVHSPAILVFLPGYCASPGRTSPCAPAFTRPLTTQDLLADMDAAGIRRGWLLSTAYLAESPMMVPPAPDAAGILRAANDFTVDQARRYPDRLAAFIGVNPLTATALPEIARWRGDPAVTGLKIHLTNSGVDLRSPEDVARLAAVFRAARESRLIVLIHMRTRAADYGAQDVRIFLRDVLPAAGGGPVVIAHAAGWGGTNANTLDALGAFAEAIERDPSVGANLWFDLAQVFDEKTSPADLAALAALIRRIGVDHFVTGSDWPFAGDLAGYYANTYPLLPLTPAEWERIARAGPAEPAR